MKNILSLLPLLWSFTAVSAQITIPASTLPAVGDQLRYSWAYDQATFDMITPPGFDLSWDFTGLTADESLTEVYRSPSEGVHAARFPGANLMTRNAAGEERYYVVSSSGMRLLGWTENTLFGEPFTVVYDFTRGGRIPAAGLNERFAPLNFFDIYGQSAGILEGFKFSELPPAIRLALLNAGLTTTDSVRLRSAYSSFHSVNAFGTVTIPGTGAQYTVLRQNTTNYREGRIDGKVIPLGWLDITDITMQYFPASIASLGVDTTGAHTFFNDVTKEEIARLPLDAEGRPRHVRYKNNAPPSCFDPDLVNATLNGNPIAAGEYAASQTITSAGRVAAGSPVAFVAGIRITLQPGFRTDANANFTARILSCPTDAAVAITTESLAAPPAGPAPGPPLPRLLSAEGRLRVYPNPVSTSARIEYSLAAPGPVWIGVSDASGRLLETLEATNWQDAGTYALDWTPDAGHPGVLFVLLKLPDGVVTQRVVWGR